MTTPRFSIIMAAYNAAATIEPAIRSALLQSESSLEVVVVDDGSVDETRAIAQGMTGIDSRVRVFTQRNAGPSAARNRATMESRGEILAFLDADDYLFPDYLERMGATLDSDPGAGLTYTDAWVLDHETGRIRRTSAMANQHPPSVAPPDPTDLLRLLLLRNFIFFPAVRRRALDAAGPWLVSLTAAEDYELWLRVVARGYRALQTPGRLAIHREMAGSNSSDLLRQLASMREVYRLVGEEWDVDNDVRTVAHARRGQIERLMRRFDPTRRDPREVVLRPLRRVRAGTLHRRLWLSTPPPEVAAVMAEAESRDTAGSRVPRITIANS